jgi:hypothetical protein
LTHSVESMIRLQHFQSFTYFHSPRTFCSVSVGIEYPFQTLNDQNLVFINDQVFLPPLMMKYFCNRSLFGVWLYNIFSQMHNNFFKTLLFNFKTRITWYHHHLPRLIDFNGCFKNVFTYWSNIQECPFLPSEVYFTSAFLLSMYKSNIFYPILLWIT